MERLDWLKAPAAKIVAASPKAPHAGQALGTHWQAATPSCLPAADADLQLATQVILMDHIDWLDAPAAKQVAQALGRQVVPGGRLILRSAALCPPYVRFIQEAGFEVRLACLGFRV